MTRRRHIEIVVLRPNSRGLGENLREVFVILPLVGPKHALTLHQGIPGLKDVFRGSIGGQNFAVCIDHHDPKWQVMDRELK